MSWLHLQYSYFEIIFKLLQSFILHVHTSELKQRFILQVATSETEIKLFQPVSTGMGDRVRGSTPATGNLSQYITSHLGQLSLAIPTRVGAMSASQRAVMPCGWGLKAGMLRECVTL